LRQHQTIITDLQSDLIPIEIKIHQTLSNVMPIMRKESCPRACLPVDKQSLQHPSTRFSP
jgi:hypothetical protein